MDPIISFQVYKKQKKQLDDISNDEKFYKKEEKWKLNRYYYDIIIPSINAFFDIETTGVNIDWFKVSEAEQIFNKKIDDIKIKLASSFNIDINSINWDSNEQVGNLLQKKNWPNYGLAKKGNYLVNDETLNYWKKDGYKEANLLLDLHSLNTLMNTFVGNEKEGNGYWQYRYPDDKIYSNFGVMLTDSHRNYSRNPNFQNIVARGDYAEIIRRYFCPPSKDYQIVSFDFSGFQLRIGCIYSGDKEMENVFKNLGGDLHSMSSSKILLNNKISVEEFIIRKNEPEFDLMRFKAKGINFSLIFNTTAISFAEESLIPNWKFEEIEKYLIENNLTNKPYTLHKSDISKDRNLDLKFCKYWTVAIDIKSKFFKTYPELKLWIDRSIKFAEEHGYVKSSFGAIRRTPQLLYQGDGKSRIIKELQNISVNSPVQNYEVSISNSVIIETQKWLKDNNKKSKIFGMTHDSIDMYVHNLEIKEIVLKLKEIAERDREEHKGIPIEIECKISDYYGKNQVWGFGKKIKIKDL
jgi:DNA polymerase-1